MARLIIRGAWVGLLVVELDKWTVPMLKDELARRSNRARNSIILISKDRLLKESDGPHLADIGVKNNDKVFISRIQVEEGQFLREQVQAEGLRSAHFALLKKAVAGLANKYADGPGPYDGYSIKLTDQSGQKFDLDSKIDKSCVMMGLLMHRKAKQLMREKSYKDAIEVFNMAEEAFFLCDPEIMKGFCNDHFLQIDMVWCYFMLRDTSFLSEAGGRLARACERIYHYIGGKEVFRDRLLQGLCLSEDIALFLRIELLQGVLAYHRGKIKKCRGLLTSAEEKLSKLQVSVDEDLTVLTRMGYEENEAKRALKLNNHNVSRAVKFLLEREKEAQKHADNIQSKKEIKFECEPAAEGLLINDNDTQKKLDNLTSPELNSEIQLDVETRKRKRQAQAKEAAILDFVSMGFERSRVESAVAACRSKEEALEMLLPSLGSGLEVLTKAASSSPNGEKSVESSSSSGESEDSEQRDAEAENELAGQLRQENALPDFDVDAKIETGAIKEYLALLPSSSSQ